MALRSDAKQKATLTALRLFRAQGYAATPLSQIFSESGTPRGSFYYHFPDGKLSLAREVIEVTRLAGLDMIGQAGRRGADVRAFTENLVAGFGHDLNSPGGVEGCPIALLGAELSRVSDDVAGRVRSAFDDWAGAIATELAGKGADDPGSRSAGQFTVAVLEGAVLVALARKSPDAYRAACEPLPGIIAALVARP